MDDDLELRKLALTSALLWLEDLAKDITDEEVVECAKTFEAYLRGPIAKKPTLVDDVFNMRGVNP